MNFQDIMYIARISGQILERSSGNTGKRLKHDVVVKQDESIGVEVEECVEEEHEDIDNHSNTGTNIRIAQIGCQEPSDNTAEDEEKYFENYVCVNQVRLSLSNSLDHQREKETNQEKNEAGNGEKHVGQVAGSVMAGSDQVEDGSSQSSNTGKQL